MLTNTTLQCGACGSELHRPLFDVDHHWYLLCDDCNSARMADAAVTPPAELYSEGYFREGQRRGGYADYDADAPLHRRNAASRLDLAVAAGAGLRRVIDVGCGTGYVLEEAERRGATAVGVDVSPYARRMATQRGLTTVERLEEALALVPAPDTITFFQSLEHLEDPQAWIEAAVTALAPGGHIVIESWDRTSHTAQTFGRHWQQANPPTVVHLFSADGLWQLLQHHGCSVVSLGRTSKWVSAGWAGAVVEGRWASLAPLVRAVRRTRVGRLPIRYPLDDLITVVARTPPQAAGTAT